MLRLELFILSILCSLAVMGQEKGCIPTKEPYPFKAGEKFELSLMYKWGAVNTEVAGAWVDLESVSFNGQPAYHTNLKIKSAPFFDLFFKMREDFHSWFSATDLRALRYTRNTLEGNYVALNDYTYDWEAKVIHADVNFSGRGQEHYEIPLHRCVYDLPALLYYIRTVDIAQMTPGSHYNLSFAIDDAVFNVVLTYHGPQRLRVRKIGQRDALKFTCTVVQGALFDGKEDLSLWLSSDSSHIPLAVMAPLKVGAVWAWIKSYKQ